MFLAVCWMSPKLASAILGGTTAMTGGDFASVGVGLAAGTATLRCLVPRLRGPVPMLWEKSNLPVQPRMGQQTAAGRRVAAGRACPPRLVPLLPLAVVEVAPGRCIAINSNQPSPSMA